MRADDAALHHRVLSIRDAAGLPEEISVLRVFDVIACRCRRRSCAIGGEDVCWDRDGAISGRFDGAMRAMWCSSTSPEWCRGAVCDTASVNWGFE
ncbi:MULTISPECIES: DUF6308 family protein [unclassified Rhodococcus (in: high G+C Gram-positive bacteria)]|uniref:DUF6308 family protein n=1 Tax=unclassified Rhodococcus (in: high G+C Gram-positive bacteria) TaxID=192944 RepID=UPI00313FF011